MSKLCVQPKALLAGPEGSQYNCRTSRLVPWCSGLTCLPVKEETASSNLVGTAFNRNEDKIAGLAFTILLDCSCAGVRKGSRAYAIDPSARLTMTPKPLCGGLSKNRVRSLGFW